MRDLYCITGHEFSILNTPFSILKTLLLIDGMAVVYRAFYALNRTPRINSKGMNTSATLGFTTTLFDLIRQQQPTHMAVAFDVSKPTFRHEMFAEYKANREAMPEAIQQSLPYIRSIIEAFGIPIVTVPGYEADDVIGTLSHAAQNAGFNRVLMVTPDKDFAQLVTDCVQVYHLGRGGQGDSIMGIAEVQEKFGVERCEQVADLLGLWGDSSDNIPGVPGVGEKTAKKLIAQFGSVENMVAHASEIKNDAIRLKVEQNADQALFSKKLATIVLDAPVAFDEEQLKLKSPDFNSLKQLFDELEFRNLAKRVFTTYSLAGLPVGSVETANASAKMEDAGRNTAKDQPSLFDEMEETGDALSIQPVTSLSDLLGADVAADVAIYMEGADLAVAINAEQVMQTTVGEVDMERLRQLLEDPNTHKVCYDLKHLRYNLAELDIALRGVIFDVQLAHYLVDAEARHSLPSIALSMLGAEPRTVGDCAAALWLIYPRLVSQLCDAGLDGLYRDIELPLVDVLIAMEQEGVRVDVGALNVFSQQLSQQRDQLQEEICQLAGKQFNISSPKQLGDVLYTDMHIVDKPPLTASKQFSTAEDVLHKLRNSHPIVEKVLQFRSVSKLLGTYVNTFPQLISPVSGRLHTVYNQTVTATGRLSSSNPNLQNIPIRTEQGREIRRAFVARDADYQVLAADYSQIELRIIAALSGDKGLLDAFNNNLDIHAATAARIYHIPLEEVSSTQRRNAKSVNFGIVYGISAFGLSEQLDIPRKEAAALIEEYFAHYPAVKDYIESNIAFAREHGYAQTLLGRRRYLPDINSRNASARAFAERNAVNMPVQGTSADMIKKAMIAIQHQIVDRGLRSRMTLQVHDELVFDLYRPEEQVMRQIVETEMVNALTLPGLAVDVSINVGDNWLEAH